MVRVFHFLDRLLPALIVLSYVEMISDQIMKYRDA